MSQGSRTGGSASCGNQTLQTRSPDSTPSLVPSLINVQAGEEGMVQSLGPVPGGVSGTFTRQTSSLQEPRLHSPLPQVRVALEGQERLGPQLGGHRLCPGSLPQV